MKFTWVPPTKRKTAAPPAFVAVPGRAAVSIPATESAPQTTSDLPEWPAVSRVGVPRTGSSGPDLDRTAVPERALTPPDVEDTPVLDGDAAAAVQHRGGHIQIVAAAGSGKTEVVSQRIAGLLVSGEPAESIVAFTFTEKAAAELKERIRRRVTAALGAEATDQLGRLFVGTIHGFCFRLLQTYVPRFETYTPLDPNQLTNLVYRESRIIGVRDLEPTRGVFRNIAIFQRGVDVIENELIDLDDVADSDFRTAVRAYYDMLDRYQFMSFGTQVVHAVSALRDPDVHRRVTEPLRHLVVDEYQDVNPAQEELIRILAKPFGTADLVVVGDDDQAIYQWRGSAVENIVTFEQRYPDVTQFRLLTNRRSRPGIIDVANRFATSIPGRIDKSMEPSREADGPSVAVAVDVGNEDDEAQSVASSLLDMRAAGLSYRFGYTVNTDRLVADHSRTYNLGTTDGSGDVPEGMHVLFRLCSLYDCTSEVDGVD